LTLNNKHRDARNLNSIFIKFLMSRVIWDDLIVFLLSTYFEIIDLV